ncbi:MAG: nucleoside/nucleotide kinase family protein, partial [Microcella sp.]|nr:nucleoside/nucleotide kinase family protein [Microcella sp.]
ELVALGRRERMGAPDTFDVNAFVALLESLRDLHNSESSVLAPGFDRRVEEPVPGAIELLPERATVIVEGNYLLLSTGGWERVAPLLDLSVAIELNEGLRLERLIARHVAFGKSPRDARAWALGPDDANARLIAPTLQRADLVYRAR